MPITKIGDGELVAVLPGERELFWMLLMNAAFIIWTLLKDYWAAHKRKTDTSAQDIQEMKIAMKQLVTEMVAVKERLNEVPSENEVELKIYQILRAGKSL